MKKREFPIARLGKSYGIKGWQKIHLLTDFPEQFTPGRQFKTEKGVVELEGVELEQGIVKLKGVNSPEEAKKFTNRTLYVSEEETRNWIQLKEGEFFWFDIIGLEVWSWKEGEGKEKEKQKGNGKGVRNWKRERFQKEFETEIGKGIGKQGIEKQGIGKQGSREGSEKERNKKREGKDGIKEEGFLVKIGKVVGIERYNNLDYLVVKVSEEWLKEGYPKRILLQFRLHVEQVDLKAGKLFSNFAYLQLLSLK